MWDLGQSIIHSVMGKLVTGCDFHVMLSFTFDFQYGQESQTVKKALTSGTLDVIWNHQQHCSTILSRQLYHCTSRQLRHFRLQRLQDMKQRDRLCSKKLLLTPFQVQPALQVMIILPLPLPGPKRKRAYVSDEEEESNDKWEDAHTNPNPGNRHIPSFFSIPCNA